MEERPTRWRELRIYSISSRGQPTRGGPPAWGLDEGVKTIRRKNSTTYNETDTACGRYGVKERWIQPFLRRIRGEGGRTLRRPKGRLNDIKTDIREIVLEGRGVD